MRSIDIDEDVYEHLRTSSLEIGESASSIVRRLLGLSSGSRRVGGAPVPIDVIAASRAPHERSLLEFVAEAAFGKHSTAKDKYLVILAQLSLQHADSFHCVLEIAGRKRLYFARTDAEILRKHDRAAPRMIPGTKFWAMTNSSSTQKRDTLRRVLAALGYGEGPARQIAQAVR